MISVDPLISVVTVTWNCAKTLEKTLLSVEAVKSDVMEYLVIDGGSTDGSLELIKAYDHIVDLLVSEEDSGIYNAMNKGAALAKGRYILFINGDDELVEQGFPAVMQAMERGKSDIICATTLVGSVKEPCEILVAKPAKLPFFNTIPHPSSFVRISLMKACPFREDLRIASDYDFFLQAFLGRRAFEVLPVVTALHQRGGASGNQDLSALEIERVRRQRLGWKYHFVEGIRNLYRVFKRIVG
ncbi:glycosyltransferase family 2 protein [Thalassospira lucentensis]|uniref:glycosyltransferase family 2 protein n=1 Tax=Thalassospira lucentensis TaxID=168935 RepID=UPI00399D6F2B